MDAKPIDPKFHVFIAFFNDPRPVYVEKLKFILSLVEIYYENSAVESRTPLRDMKSLFQLIMLQKAVKLEKTVVGMLKSQFNEFTGDTFQIKSIIKDQTSGHQIDADISMVNPQTSMANPQTSMANPQLSSLLNTICDQRKASFTLNWPVVDWVTAMHPLIIQMVSLFFLCFYFILLQFYYIIIKCIIVFIFCSCWN